jgi:hypothetical protein
MQPEGPFCPLFLTGPRGSGKSTLAERLVSILDPSADGLVGELKHSEDIFSVARGRWVYALDNLSKVDSTLSDYLCCVSNGVSHQRRSLYTNSDVHTVRVCRAGVLTSIDELLTRADVLDRSLVVSLPARVWEDNDSDDELRRYFEGHKPPVLGAVFDGLVETLRNDPRRRRKTTTRNKGFAFWGAAAMSAAGHSESDFLRDLDDNSARAAAVVCDTSPLVGPLLALLREKAGAWEGTMSDLLGELTRVARLAGPLPHGWPTVPHHLGGRLGRMTHELQLHGVRWERPDHTNHRKAGRVVIELLADPPG